MSAVIIPSEICNHMKQARNAPAARRCGLGRHAPLIVSAASRIAPIQKAKKAHVSFSAIRARPEYTGDSHSAEGSCQQTIDHESMIPAKSHSVIRIGKVRVSFTIIMEMRSCNSSANAPPLLTSEMQISSCIGREPLCLATAEVTS